MEIVVLTPERELYSGSIKSVEVPGTKGRFQVLRGHAPIVSSLDAGDIRVVDQEGNNHAFKIEKGFIEVLRDQVSVLVVEPHEEENGEEN